MNLSKKNIISKYGKNSLDSGNTAVQISLLTYKINNLQNHFSIHKKDFSGRTGLLKMVSKRRKLLKYMRKKSVLKYNFIIKDLKIRR
ncbi:30S ribosomal protein S15 [Buchnera aphidicola (Chaitophorus viminalis)]|nr:30S ribosomal protein S15 [Buchnera aphidicola]MCW5197585.1 30S ribosomal protein S15 [Buchnera aphidicola (Chaitophorus viminalis)]